MKEIDPNEDVYESDFVWVEKVTNDEYYLYDEYGKEIASIFRVSNFQAEIRETGFNEFYIDLESAMQAVEEELLNPKKQKRKYYIISAVVISILSLLWFARIPIITYLYSLIK